MSYLRSSGLLVADLFALYVRRLVIGNTPCSNASKGFGLHCGTFTPAEEETVMALWSLWSAPLLMSNDLPNIPPASKKLLLCVTHSTVYSTLLLDSNCST
jgi:hypothetical protein